MRRPFKNREAYRKIKESLISNYSEYISLNKTKENPQKLVYLITLISSIESKLITHLKSRRMKYIPPNPRTPLQMVCLLCLLNPRTPLQIVSEHSNLKSTKEI